MIKAVIFDMDGLLIDSEPLWHEAEMLIFREVNLTLQKSDCLKTTGLRVDEVVDYWYRRHRWDCPPKAEIANKILHKVVELIREKALVKEGVAEVINFVTKLDIKVALASSSAYKIINTVIDKLALQESFEVVYSAQEEEYGKPHPGVYLTTARRLQVAPTECLAIEDSLNGVLAAKAARMRCIAVPEPAWRADRRFVIADAIVESLTEIDQQLWQKLNQQED
jgi:mannitol-1-/sugar-/sorbitol-6-/2-deoxyglucose-6-phosphatase